MIKKTIILYKVRSEGLQYLHQWLKTNVLKVDDVKILYFLNFTSPKKSAELLFRNFCGGFPLPGAISAAVMHIISLTGMTEPE